MDKSVEYFSKLYMITFKRNFFTFFNYFDRNASYCCACVGPGPLIYRYLHCNSLPYLFTATQNTLHPQASKTRFRWEAKALLLIPLYMSLIYQCFFAFGRLSVYRKGRGEMHWDRVCTHHQQQFQQQCGV